MIGHYWSTGIVLRYHGSNEWSARAEFRDCGFAEIGSSEGEVRARYVGALSDVVDLVKREIEALGIKWYDSVVPDAPSWLYYEGDGESKEYPPPPNWHGILKAEAERIGFKTYAHAMTGTKQA